MGLRKLYLVLMCGLAVTAGAQTVNLTGTQFKNLAGHPLTGQFCLMPVSGAGVPINFQWSAGGEGTNAQTCFAITAGVLQSGVMVPDTALSNPQNLCLFAQAVNPTAPGGPHPVFTYQCLQPGTPQGSSDPRATWCTVSGSTVTCDLDHYPLVNAPQPLDELGAAIDTYTLPIATTTTLGGVEPDGTNCQVSSAGVLTCAGTFSLTSAGIDAALGFTPYNATNPNGYITSSALSGYMLSSAFTAAAIESALGFTPYNSTNPAGYITSSALSPYMLSSSFTAAAIESALGFTPYSASNPNGYITSSALSGYMLSSAFTAAAIESALGFTPYNATNPAGYITSSITALPSLLLPYSQLSGAPTALPPNGMAGGDLSGSYPNPTVAKINGTAPPITSGSLWCTSSLGYVSACTTAQVQAAIGASVYDAYGAALARAAVSICTSGQYATGTGTSTTPCAQVAYSQVSGTPTGLPPNGGAGGDLSGSYPNPTVAKINGTAPPTTSGSLWCTSSLGYVSACTTAQVQAAIGASVYDTYGAANTAQSNAEAYAASLTAGQVTATGSPASGQMAAFAGAASVTSATAHNESLPRACTTTNSGNTYSCTTSPSFAPAAGDQILVKFSAANTGSATLNVNAAGADTLYKWGNTSTLASGDIQSGHYISATFDGSHWQLEGQLGNAEPAISCTLPQVVTAISAAGVVTCAEPSNITGTSTNTTATTNATLITLSALALPATQITGTINATEVNGATVPASAKAVATNSSGQIVAAAVAGAGAGLTTGPTTSAVGDIMTAATTTGQIQDSGVLLGSLPTMSSVNIWTNENQFSPGELQVAGVSGGATEFESYASSTADIVYFPNAAGTVALTNFQQTWTAQQVFPDNLVFNTNGYSNATASYTAVTSLALANLPASTAVEGYCDVLWKSSSTSGTATFALGLSEAPTLLYVDTEYSNGTYVPPTITDITNTTVTAVTAAMATTTANTYYVIHIHFVLNNGSSANTLTVYAESNSTSYTVSVGGGSSCRWF